MLSFIHRSTTQIYTLSLHDALPIYHLLRVPALERQLAGEHLERHDAEGADIGPGVELLAPDLLRAHELRGAERSEEHTSELQSHSDLVCRLLLEKKKKKITTISKMG